jgi:hypothetical protein
MLIPPSDAVRLSGDPDPETTTGPVEAPAPPRGGHSLPGVPATALAGAAAVLAAAGARRRDPAPGDGLSLEPDPLVVFVPGHGNDRSTTFADLTEMMDLEAEQVRVFDYRWAVEEHDEVQASMRANIEDTADALNAYLAGLADGGRPMYLVGFSKGGAGIAELVARWDDGSPARIPGVRGAALLDPPISGGLQGEIQSLGRVWGPIPDDGGYDPVQCRWMWLGCRDARDNLGRASGIPTLVIRNPKAGITNFDDHPANLRVHDAADAGRGPLDALLRDPLGYPGRVTAAHESVLSNPGVADCLVSEMRDPGTCPLPRSDPYAPRFARGGTPGGTTLGRWSNLAREWMIGR